MKRAEFEKEDMKECTFQPNIGGSPAGSPAPDMDGYMERQEEWQRTRAAKLEESRKRLEEEEKTKAADMTFSPTIHDMPESSRMHGKRVKKQAGEDAHRARMEQARDDRAGKPRRKGNNTWLSPMKDGEESPSPPVDKMAYRKSLSQPTDWRSKSLNIDDDKIPEKMPVYRKRHICPTCKHASEQVFYSALLAGLKERGMQTDPWEPEPDGPGQDEYDALEDKLRGAQAAVTNLEKMLARERARKPKEVIKEVVKEVIKEVIKVKEVPVEKRVEVIVEKIVPGAAPVPTGPPKRMADKETMTDGSLTPPPAAAPREGDADKFASHKGRMAGAAKDVRVCIAKIKAAAGDKVKMKAALALSKEVANTIGVMLHKMHESSTESVKTNQLKDLGENMLSINTALDKGRDVLENNHTDAVAIKKMEATLIRLEDVAEVSLQEGDQYKLKAELMDAVKKVPLFAGINNVGFFMEIVRMLEDKTFQPNKYIARYGEEGDSMYFITKGTCAVIIQDGTEVAKMGEGKFFGEIALLTGGKRTATIRTDTYVDVYRLSKESFNEALSHFPEFSGHFEKAAQERLQADALRAASSKNTVDVTAKSIHTFRENVLEKSIAKVEEAIKGGKEEDVRRSKLELSKSLGELQKVVEDPRVRASAGRANEDINAAYEQYASDHNVEALFAHVEGVKAAAFRCCGLSEMRFFLRQYELFSYADEPFRAELLARCDWEQIPAKTRLSNKSRLDATLFFVAQGSVCILLPSGERAGNITEGGYFGETTFLTGAAEDDIGETNDAVEVCKLTRQALEEVLNLRPEYKEPFMEHVKKRTENLSKAMRKVRKTTSTKDLVNKETIAEKDLSALSAAFASVKPSDFAGVPRDQLVKHRSLVASLLAALDAGIEAA